MKVYEEIIRRDFEIVINKKEQHKSLALKAKKMCSDDEDSCSDSEDEEYAMAVREFKKFFKRRGNIPKQHRNDQKSPQRFNDNYYDEDERKCYGCDNTGHLVGKCPKSSKNNKQNNAFIGETWCDSDKEKKDTNNTCLVAQASDEICQE